MNTVAGHLLVAHGSSHARWRRPFEAVATGLSGRHPERLIRLCYLEKWAPDVPAAIEDLYQKGCRHLRVSPLFLSSGRHLEKDLPEVLATCLRPRPDLVITAEPPLGEYEDFVKAVLEVLS